jgi:Skp family chaperone for outer membrane proteins
MKTKLVIFSLLYSMVLSAQNFAYIQQDSILKSVSNYEKTLISIDSVSKSYQKEIKTMQEEWNIKVGLLLKPYNVKENENIDSVKSRMTAIDTTKLSILLDEDKIFIKRAKSYDEIVKQKYQTEVQPILNRVNNAITTYAKKNKIDVVYVIENLRPALAYIDKKKNITGVIITMLKSN